MFPSSDNVTKPYWNKNGSDIIFENVMCKYSGNINVSNIESSNSKKNIKHRFAGKSDILL